MQDLSVVEQIKQIGILYYSLLTGQLAMLVLLFLFVENKINPSEPAVDGAVVNNSMPLIITFICVVSISTAFFIYNKRKESGRRLTGNLIDKLAHYRASFMVRAAMIEGANLLALVTYFFIDKNYILLLLFAVGIGAFVMIRPTVDQIAEDYQLSSSEQSEIRNSVM